MKNFIGREVNVTVVSRNAVAGKAMSGKVVMGRLLGRHSLSGI